MNISSMNILKDVTAEQWACILSDIDANASRQIWEIIYDTIDDYDQEICVPRFIEKINFHLNEIKKQTQ